ncbi:hypothetical protein MMC25_005026 [Agyrium rufum]|nr:hypothetical protein [Agyrium rufum]
MSSNTLHTSLLRPPILHILRASGFHACRPAAVDTLVDLAQRYLILLATRTAAHAYANHFDGAPTITDARMALEDIRALYPQISSVEEKLRGEEDLRGVEAFIDWIKGDACMEMRRIAGMLPGEVEAVDVEAGGENEDFLTALKKKHSKTGEESRFQGTALGKIGEQKPVVIEGGSLPSIREWEARMRESGRVSKASSVIEDLSSPPSTASSPLSELD